MTIQIYVSIILKKLHRFASIELRTITNKLNTSCILLLNETHVIRYINCCKYTLIGQFNHQLISWKLLLASCHNYNIHHFNNYSEMEWFKQTFNYDSVVNVLFYVHSIYKSNGNLPGYFYFELSGVLIRCWWSSLIRISTLEEILYIYVMLYVTPWYLTLLHCDQRYNPLTNRTSWILYMFSEV
jgi:hypothetical protein